MRTETLHGISTDRLEQVAVAAEQAIARIRGIQLGVLAELDRGQANLRQRLDLGGPAGGASLPGMARYRLQPRHVVPRSCGGSHDPDNLRTLCWFHHHVVTHGHGFIVDPTSPIGRTRFLASRGRRAPP